MQPEVSAKPAAVVFPLLVSVFVIATCGLIYELVAGALASYLLGDSVTQFSTVIGVYLFAMGIGSYLSRYVKGNLTATFIQVEFLIGLVGGSSAAILFFSFEFLAGFRVVLYGLVSITGIMVGLEIPLLMRILRAHVSFTELVSQVFTFDYIGALLASLLFPLVLVPYLGLMRAAMLFGILNVIVGLWALNIFKEEVRAAARIAAAGVTVLALLVAGIVYADDLLTLTETAHYPAPVIHSRQSPYQRIVLTREQDDVRLFLNGNLQFSSRDEYRYHEALVHPGLQQVLQAKHVLILGGGDGLAAREILRYPNVDSITLVDLDPAITNLFKSHPLLTQLNQNSLASPKLILRNEDAFLWIRNCNRQYDFIVVDFPDPGNYSIGKLYSTAFYKELYRIISPSGFAVVQSTSPWVARKSYWCVDATLRACGFKTTPYHAYVPAFGDWGFILCGRGQYTPAPAYMKGLRYINPQTVQQMLQFPPDMGPVTVSVNRLNNQALVHYFEAEWSNYIQ